MGNGNKTQAPIIKFDEILELLNSNGASGLTFDAISIHIYNSRRDLFVDEPSLQQIKKALRNFFHCHNDYFHKDDHDHYLLKEMPPTQLYFDFENINDDNELQESECEENTSKAIQLEFKFD